MRLFNIISLYSIITKVITKATVDTRVEKQSAHLTLTSKSSRLHAQK